MRDELPPIEIPFLAEGLKVLPAWIDSNGHFNIAYYLHCFDLAYDRVYDQFGFERGTAETLQASTFAAEMHLSFKRELFEGAPLRITTQLIDVDPRRVYFVQAMYHADEGYLAATVEWLILYIDMNQRRVAAMPPKLQAHLARVLEAHRTIPLPAPVGRGISIPRRSPTDPA
ncbi:thioesterase family protein [Hypericibacter sp.]|uniref:thioesterase family protein n=1 Tax=Hypericibacter sp. TaxID=2705401 RepID=UPI003D6D73CB